MQVPILSGSATDENSDFRTSYPRNYIPVPKEQGISNGYLRPYYGIRTVGTGEGSDRAAVVWQGKHYRLSGTKLIEVATDGTTSVLGDVGGSGQEDMDYSFDRLSVQSSGRFFYWDGTTLTEVTDPDLGVVLSHIWVDGYFMYVDDEDNLVVSDLSDPTSINPLRYGSSEVDPDKLYGVAKVRNEPYAVNRHTIESFQNNPNASAGLFPFVRIGGAQITKGAVGSHAFVEFEDTLAFVGGGRNESVGVYLGANGSYTKISDREIDQVLNELTDAQLLEVVCERQNHDGHRLLHIRLPDRTLVYDAAASGVVGQAIWFELGTGLSDHNKHRQSNMTWFNGKWWVGDPDDPRIGELDDSIGSHWGEEVGWRFDTGILYNEGNGAMLHEMELVALTGRIAQGSDPNIWTRNSSDGETYSQPRFVKAGKQGNRNRKLAWQSCGMVRNWRIQRFEGTSLSHLSFARLEVKLSPLAW